MIRNALSLETDRESSMVMTRHAGRPTAMEVSGTGLDATVRVRGGTVRFDSDRIVPGIDKRG